MGQYEVAKIVQESDRGWETTELSRQFDLSRGAIDQSLRELVRKGYLIKKDDGRFIWNPDVDEKEIEKIRPKTLDELDF